MKKNNCTPSLAKDILRKKNELKNAMKAYG